ncbi:MAG TPA: universal stress protein [Bacteroidales bacterium]|nr:universal stress protein [Bacteroidales bacterium]
MKTIIVPVDFSDLSLRGLDFAIILAKKHDASIQLVNVLEETRIEYKSDTEKEKRKAGEKFEEVLNQYAGRAEGIEISHIVKQGKVQNEVVEQAESFDDAVIVTSTHGGSGFEELFIGSNAYKIVSSTSRPVFTLRGDMVPHRLKKIVLPIDSTSETREKVPFTAQLASRFGAEVHLVTVTSAQVEDIVKKLDLYANQVQNYLKNMKVKCVKDSLYGDNLTDITIDYARSVGADLISIMSEQEKSISNLLLGNYAHQMINKSTIPVLVISNRHIGIITESFKTEGIYYEQ